MNVDRPIREWNGLIIPDPGVYTLDDAHKRIGFVAQHMMVSPIRGEFAQGSASILVAEDPLQSQVSASIVASSINTHNPERDTHLASGDFLDVARYRTLEFRSTGITWEAESDPIFQWARLRNNPLARRGAQADLPSAATRASGRFVVAGMLTIKDVTRPIKLHMEFGGARRDPYGRDIFGFSASAEFEREDYGLVWNVLLESGGVLVGKKVRIEIAGEAIRGS
ncbi:polyisoprenoid-binding protein YceI [Actinoplanes lutulentus]|uniref:Polyisoprenoid-binding protein YceI n=1 Tax=Actinoplanes lutulentus TaxID=1287878 RepID=A0A327Z3X0_9ACTN|nr:YceI family protein [Actinoplanes lutulentus]MBB2943723.1 polyisoprenoid-binding protein YceI [Actinoplanes lutulentus]RAK29265.1 polyisoprenoid-binding protein YceI [Actinoplanes lutulentus]